jgi:hypothetical protein
MIKSGFLVLGDCGRPTPLTCHSCGRPFCAAHTSSEDSSLCIECSVPEEREDDSSESTVYGGQSEEDFYAYRRHHYQDHDYTPEYEGAGGDFDEFDVIAFESSDADINFEGEGEEDFDDFDS